MPLRDYLIALFVVVLWGLNFIAVKVAVVAVPPFLLTASRFALVALVVAPLFRPRRDQIKGIAAVALVLGVGHFGMMFWGLKGLDAASSAIVNQLGVPFSALLAWVFFGERLDKGQALGLVLAFAGVALLAGEPGLPHIGPLLATIAAMAAWALGNVLVKRLGTISPLALNGWMALLATPMLLALSVATEPGLDQVPARLAADWKPWAGLSYTVIASSLIAYSLWYGLLSRHAMNKVVPLTLLGPVVGIAGGVLILGETATWQKLVGGALTVGGVALMQALSRRPTLPEPEPGS